MKKTIKRISALALTGLLGMTALAGCSREQSVESDQTLEVYIIDTGYRTDGAKAIVNSFAEQDWVKTKYPNLQVKFTTNNMEGFALNKVKTPKTNEFDLLFTSDEMISTFEKNSKGEYLLTELTDVVYNSEVLDQAGKKYIDAVNDTYLEYVGYTSLTDDVPKYFQVPWVTGLKGLLYSEEILARYGYTDGKTPNTTDELLALCEAIKNNPENSGNSKGYSILHHANYWNDLIPTWWAQYDGMEAYTNFWRGTYVSARGETEYSNKIFELEGRLKALEVMYEMLRFENKYYDIENYDKGDFMQRQTNFLKGQYALGVNADWYDTEMKSTVKLLEDEGITPHTIKIMKMPIVSDLIDHLDTVNEDDKLSAVIAAIDEGKSYEETKEIVSGLSETDYKRIMEARGVYLAPGMGHSAVVPAKANSQDVALDVLKYMATKNCQEAYMKATGGQNLPFDYDFDSAPQDVLDSISPLQKDRLAYFYNKNYTINILKPKLRYPLVRYANFSMFSTNVTTWHTIFSLENVTSTPQKVFDDTVKHWTKDTFEFALQQAGYIEGQG